MHRLALVALTVVVLAAAPVGPACAADAPVAPPAPAPAPAPAAPKEWAARHILVAWKGAQRAAATRTKEEARTIADQVAAAAKQPGADFAALSHQYSDDKVSDGSGGFLGFFVRGTMTPAFQSAVEALAEGQVSGVVETPFGYHVIQRLSRADADALQKASRAAVVAAVFPWKGAQGAGPNVTRPKDLARDDAERAAGFLRNGGTFPAIPPELGAVPQRPGWSAQVLVRGMVVPAYKAIGDAAFGTAVGAVSAPVETPSGYMVLRRVEYFRIHVEHLVVLYKGGAAGERASLSKDEARARAAEALAKYVADPAAWRTIVATYSDEPGAGERSGSLGVAEPGFVPEFDAAIATLAPGAHTDVFETPFGFHVARRVD